MRITPEGLSKRYGSARPLNGISLTIEPGQIASTIFLFVSGSELKFYAPLAMFMSGGLIWAMYGWLHSRGRLDVLSAPSNLQ
jgi:hypothetical protein